MTNISAKIVYNDEVLLDIRANMRYANIDCLDRGSLSSIVEYGCYANRGEFSFVDEKKAFKEIYDRGILYDCIINIFISGNYGDNRKQIATFLIEDFEYDDTYVVHVTLKDPILNLQDKPFPKIREFDEITLYDIFNKYCFGVKLSNVAGIIFREIKIKAAYTESSSLWNFVNKLCQATLCQCYSDTDGIPIIVAPPPSKYGICSIRPKHIKTIAEKVSKDKTKIASASISILNRTISKNSPVGDEKHKTIYNAALWNNDLTLESASFVADEANSDVTIARRDGQYISVSYTINSYGTIHRLTRDRRSIIFAKEIFGPSVNNDGNFPYNVQTITKRKYIETTEKAFSISGDGKSASVTTNLFSINNMLGTNYIDIYTDIYCNIYGDFFVDKGEITRSFGSGTNVTQISTNELIQYNSVWGDIFLPEKMLSIIQEKYLNGIECVELECIIGNYTYASGSYIKYSPSNPDLNYFSFNRYDIVRPYVIKNGLEVPYSTDADGNAKDFVIIGIRYNYDGILRQSLMLQEFKPYTI